MEEGGESESDLSEDSEMEEDGDFERVLQAERARRRWVKRY